MSSAVAADPFARWGSEREDTCELTDPGEGTCILRVCLLDALDGEVCARGAFCGASLKIPF